MGFLDRFKKKLPRLSDPTFGEITYEQECWRGKILFRPCSDEVAINVESDERGPTDQQRSLYRELEQKYQQLLPLIGVALWDLYRPVRAEFEGDPGAQLGPSDPTGMAEHTELFAIDIDADGRIELGYSFDAKVGWDDAMFNVEIVEWTPRPVSLDD